MTKTKSCYVDSQTANSVLTKGKVPVADEVNLPVCKFHLGRLVATPNALRALADDDWLNALKRHRICDWGDIDNKDRQANERAIVEGTRLLSVYHSIEGVRFWIITEADRSATTVLLPEDY